MASILVFIVRYLVVHLIEENLPSKLHPRTQIPDTFSVIHLFCHFLKGSALILCYIRFLKINKIKFLMSLNTGCSLQNKFCYSHLFCLKF